jgi:hypothetical protein
MVELKKIVFYNDLHNGDQHFCRGFVRNVMQHCMPREIKIFYYHKNDPKLLSDIPNVKHILKRPKVHQRRPFKRNGPVLFFNTWYRADKEIFDKYTVSFNTLYEHFARLYEMLDLKIADENPLDLFPEIDASKYNVAHIDKFAKNTAGKKRVLISNGQVKSGQCQNIDLNPAIRRLANRFPGILFIASDKEGKMVQLPNVHYANDINCVSGCDLNENGYLSTFCDMIVGRCSGTYSFATNRTNYYDNPKEFLCFSRMRLGAIRWIKNFDVIPKPPASIFCYPESNPAQIFETVSKHIDENGWG